LFAGNCDAYGWAWGTEFQKLGAALGACLDEYIPKNRPTLMETATARIMDQRGMEEGRLGTRT
jgi:hypothetical protein